VPAEARWGHLLANARQPTIGKTIDAAMAAIERDNPRLKGVLPKDYARLALDKHLLGELLDFIGTIGLGDREKREKDIPGSAFEYFLGLFARADGKRFGDAHTPESVGKLLVHMIAPHKGRVYDPCNGSCGLFILSKKFVEAQGGNLGDIAMFGQESNPKTWSLGIMNLAMRGIEADLGKHAADTFENDLHPDLRADYILAHFTITISNWSRSEDDVRWKYGLPPKRSANFAWIQHIIHHLAPNGMAGFVSANGAMFTNLPGEGEIRRAIIEADLVDCIVALPGQLLYSAAIPICLWSIARNKNDRKFRDRRGETLFVDARNMGTLVSRAHRELSDDDIERIVSTYHAWRGDKRSRTYEDVPGFCKSVTAAEIATNGHILVPALYVETEQLEPPVKQPAPRAGSDPSRTARGS
jgi:type I restriction enzyme M protein